VAHEPELWIVGAGPAAVILAEACVARGISIGLVAPDPEAPWQPNYGLWIDDAEALGVGALIGPRWARAEACFAGVTHTLERGYGLLDDRRLQLEALARCRAGGATIVDARVQAIEHDDEGVTLELDDGQRLRARLVVDASGYASPFIELQAGSEPGSGPGHQVAWGELWAVEGPRSAELMTFMDWTETGPEERDEELPPTFLYAMPLPEGRLFVEETILTAHLDEHPSAYFEPLARRLHRRLDRLGIVRSGAAPIEVERCIIPMGGPLPRLDQRTLGFGGAAGMVHPATGYMVTHALRRRDRVAEAIAEQLRAWVGPGRPSRAIWRAIWSADELRAWRLYGFGMEVLASLDRAGIDRFFAEFFTLPEPRWRGFVSANDSSAALMTTMLRYYAAAPGPIRRRLSLGLFGPEGRRLVRGLLGSSG
jgi:lycopene cyclase-like protein